MIFKGLLRRTQCQSYRSSPLVCSLAGHDVHLLLLLLPFLIVALAFFMFSPESSNSFSDSFLTSSSKTLTLKRRNLSDSSLSRKRSLRLPTQPFHIPVPPSLKESPHLTSPQSIFRRAFSTPRIPSQEDEQWLQDTIPVAGDEQLKLSPPRSPLSQSNEPDSEHCRGRSPGPRRQGASGTYTNPPCSPPLLISRHSDHHIVMSARPRWLTENKSHSDSNISHLAQDGYFSRLHLRVP